MTKLSAEEKDIFHALADVICKIYESSDIDFLEEDHYGYGIDYEGSYSRRYILIHALDHFNDAKRLVEILEKLMPNVNISNNTDTEYSLDTGRVWIDIGDMNLTDIEFTIDIFDAKAIEVWERLN